MHKGTRRKLLLGVWLVVSLGASAYLVTAIMTDGAGATGSTLAWGKTFFVPGATTHGHHQIELDCQACHATPFAGREAMQRACLGCHEEELEQGNNSHPVRLFTDPRNFQMRQALDAVYCVSCHVEHKPELTRTGGVTIPRDFCIVCHRDVGAKRATHKGLESDSCGNAGCHNYHDNRALYQEFLLKHTGEPALFHSARIDIGNLPTHAPVAARSGRGNNPHRRLLRGDQDSAGHLDATPTVLKNWASSAHAKAGVNCSGCHRPADAGAWVAQPKPQACASCHKNQVDGWLAGMHGMRVVQGLSPMTPARADLPMKPDARNRKLTCNSCHAAHRFDTRRAVFKDCVQCHDDAHSLAFRGSPHFKAWKRQINGAAPDGSGVSCATCHMPRVAHKENGIKRIATQHNQNANLAPNTKMLRGVCMDCHGLGFALDALADKQLIENNFAGRPSVHVPSLDMAQRAARRHRARQREQPGADR